MLTQIQQKLSYYPNLLGQTDILIQQSVNDKRQLEEYLNFMLQRMHIEQDYSNQLSKLLVWTEQSNLSTTKQYIINHLTIQTQLINNYVEFLKNELVEQSKEVLRHQQNVVKKVIDEMKALEWDLQDKQDDLVNSKLDYKISARELEASNIVELITLYLKESTDDKKYKASTKTQSYIEEFQKLEKDYQMLVYNYNEYIDIYSTKMENYLAQLEQQQQEKLLVQKDTLMKMYMFENQIIKQLSINLDKINESVRKQNIQDQIEQFVRMNQKPSEIPKNIEFVKYKSFIGRTLEDIYKNQYQKDKQLLSLAQDKFTQILDDVVMTDTQQLDELAYNQLIQTNSIEALYRIFSIQIYSIWNGQDLEVNKQIQNLLNQNKMNKMLWFIALENIGSKKSFQIPNEITLELLEKYFGLVIKSSIDQLDVCPLRKMIILSSLLYLSTMQKKKYFLANCFKDHKLFQAGDFIEACFIQSIFDGLIEDIPIQMIYEEKIKKQKLNVLTQVSQTSFVLLLYNQKNTIKMYAESYLKNCNIMGDAPKQILDQIDFFENE